MNLRLLALRILGMSICAIGCLFILTALLGLLDPSGSQQANDVDPFGTPAAAIQAWIELALSLAVLALGTRICMARQPVAPMDAGMTGRNS